MKLSQECAKSIDTLADRIARLIKNYPQYQNHLYGEFRKEFNRLKGYGSETAAIYDLDFINQLGDIHSTPNHTKDSIAALVDTRSTSTVEHILAQIEELIDKRNYDWTDRAIVNHITTTLKSKPESAVLVMDKTLNLCDGFIQKLEGDLDYATSKFNEDPRQIILSSGLKLA